MPNHFGWFAYMARSCRLALRFVIGRFEKHFLELRLHTLNLVVRLYGRITYGILFQRLLFTYIVVNKLIIS